MQHHLRTKSARLAPQNFQGVYLSWFSQYLNLSYSKKSYHQRDRKTLKWTIIVSHTLKIQKWIL